MRKERNYLIHFVNRHLDFRFVELECLLEMFGIDYTQVYDRRFKEKNAPFMIISLPSEEIARELQGRATLITKVLELWGHGADYEVLEESLKAILDETKSPYLAAEASWSIIVEGVNVTLTIKQQDHARYRIVECIPFEGDVSINNAQNKFRLIEHHLQFRGSPVLEHIYFGREIGTSRGRELVGLGDLKRRAYLGPTSLDNEIALLMASYAQIRPGSLVFDPFVGTGSILIACSHFGAFCVGTDIDIRVLKGKNGRNISTNFVQYGLSPPELIRSDNALYDGHFRCLPIYDAIVCDPPYGIRAGARRSGTRRSYISPIADHQREDHIPQTRPYPVNEVMDDLLSMAAKALKVGGRLVYLLPVDLSDETPPGPLPEHPCLKLLHVTDQRLTSKLIRKMILMRKTKEPAQ